MVIACLCTFVALVWLYKKWWSTKSTTKRRVCKIRSVLDQVVAPFCMNHHWTCEKDQQTCIYTTFYLVQSLGRPCREPESGFDQVAGPWWRDLLRSWRRWPDGSRRSRARPQSSWILRCFFFIDLNRLKIDMDWCFLVVSDGVAKSCYCFFDVLMLPRNHLVNGNLLGSSMLE